MPLEAYLCSRRQPKENNELIVNTPQQTFRAALGQFFVKETSTENLAAARSLIERSETAGADCSCSQSASLRENWACPSGDKNRLNRSTARL